MNNLLIFLFGITVLCFEAKSEEIKLRCFCHEHFSIKSQKATWCIEELHLRIDTTNKRVNALVWVYDRLIDTFNFLLVDITDDEYLFGNLPTDGMHVGSLNRNTGKLQVSITSINNSEVTGHTNYYYCKRTKKL